MQPYKVEPSEEEQYTRGKIPQQLHMSYIEDEFDLTNPIQTKADSRMRWLSRTRSAAGMKMEERTEGDERHGGSQIGGRLAARICIYSKTVI